MNPTRIKYYVTLCIGFLMLHTDGLIAQTDTVFWFVAPNVSSIHGDRPVYFRFTSFERPAQVRITAPGIVPNRLIQDFQLPPNTQITYRINDPNFYETIEGNIQNNGIKIISDTPITAYYEIEGRSFNSDIYVLKGRYALGQEFVLPLQTAYENQLNLGAVNGAQVVATQDSTVITVIPRVSINFFPAQDTVRITLNRGQTYAFGSFSERFEHRLNGTIIRATKDIAVSLTDDSVLTIDTTGTAMGSGRSWDLVGDQLLPMKYAGTRYVLPRGFVVMAALDTTSVEVAGQTYALNTANNRTVTFFNETPRLVETKIPVVVQYIDRISSGDYELGGSILPPLECSGSRSVTVSRTSFADRFWFHLVFRTSTINDFELNREPFLIDTGTVVQLDANLSYVFVEAEYPFNQPLRLTNSFAPFQLGIGGGGNRTGFQSGYFSNFRNDVADTLYACGEFESTASYLETLDIYVDIKVDTLERRFDSVFVQLTLQDEYCTSVDSAWVIQSQNPTVPFPDTLYSCAGVDSVVTLETSDRSFFNNTIGLNSLQLDTAAFDVYLENSAGCFSTKRVVSVVRDSLLAILPVDTFLCAGSTLEISLELNIDTFLVSGMETVDRTFIIDSDTVLYLEGGNSCGSFNDTLLVREIELPAVSLGSDREVCALENEAQFPTQYQYRWSDGSTEPFFRFSSTAQVSVIVTDTAGCQTLDTVDVVYKNIRAVPDLIDQSICPNTVLSIDLGSNHDSYRWSDGVNTQQRNLVEGSYALEVITEVNDTVCYQFNDQLEVREWGITLPNIITPNGDGLNETLTVNGLEPTYQLKLEVFDRWGARVFRDNNYQNDWQVPTELVDGVYYYWTSVPDFNCTEVKGWLMIQR